MKEVEKKEIIDGLRSSQATLPVKLLYDNLGGKLFDAITETEEYTPTKDELSETQGWSMENAIALATVEGLFTLGCALVGVHASFEIKRNTCSYWFPDF